MIRDESFYGHDLKSVRKVWAQIDFTLDLHGAGVDP